MASTSSSSGNKHDVFLSFRGEDTRENFTSHLYEALRRKQIATFIDNQLIRGDEISQSLLNAIEGSNISIIIFSERYASSGWCLDELVKILECKNIYGQIVIPVFYRVDPSHVRNQTGAFGDSFLKLGERFKDRLDKLERWRNALKYAANLSGFDSQVIRPESVLIEEIVKDILKRLSDMFTSDENDQLVGVESIIKEIESLLIIGSKDVYILGICGIGGIGKTTISGAIFNKISNHFESSYFIQNVREESEKTGGLAHLQRELLSSLLEDGNVKIGIPNINFNFVRKMLSRKKILIVFDDVTCLEQIELLIGGLDHFAAGSRIIITTRDKQVLRNCRVNTIYEMKELVNADALKLFSRYAFGPNHPNIGYKELSNEVIKYAHGVPLALKILGSFLFGRSKEDWESAISKLKKSPHMDIQKVLKISYDGLDDEEQNIFLDIACFFKGEDKDLVMKFLDASGFSAHIGMRVLIDKSLVIISKNKITIHDLLQEMGKEIVRQESITDPGKRSRLWNHQDVYEVLTYNMGTEAIQGISLDMSKIEGICLNFRTFTKMRKLRFLKFYGGNKCKVRHFADSGSIFRELRYLHWQGYPIKSLPSNIPSKNLVSLELPGSNIKQLWNGVQHLYNLKYMDLRDSKNLTQIPDLSLIPNLENLDLQGCTALIDIHSSIQLESLKCLYLSGCSNLKRFPEISCNIEEVCLDGTAIAEVPSSIEFLSRLVYLDLQDCSRIESLPSNLCKLKALKKLYISGCSKLERLPEEFANLEALEELLAVGTSIRELPSSIACLNNLDTLFFGRFVGGEQRGSLFPVPFSLDGFRSLELLKLAHCGITEVPESLWKLSSLTGLILDQNNFDRISESIIHLSNLSSLTLSHCQRLQSLPELPCSLQQLTAYCCESLETLSGLSVLFMPASWTYDRQIFNFMSCPKLNQNEVREIIEAAQQKIQLIATAWWKARDQEDCDVPTDGRICFPGNEIPEWFSFKSMGCYIKLELPPGWFNNNFVGFALCAIVAFRDDHDHNRRHSVACECEIKTSDGEWHVARCSVFDWGGGDAAADHVLLAYNFEMYSDGFDDYDSSNEAIFNFFFMDTFDVELVDCCEVKKCGIHLMYAQNSGDLAESSSRSFISSTEEEEQARYKRLRST